MDISHGCMYVPYGRHRQQETNDKLLVIISRWTCEWEVGTHVSLEQQIYTEVEKTWQIIAAQCVSESKASHSLQPLLVYQDR
jgi:hypothetical protein